MPALNFKHQFAALVESGKKKCTIRAKRKNPVKTGDRLYLYTGQRTKSCRKLGESICLMAESISIHRTYIELNGRKISVFDGEYTEVAMTDGFTSVREFKEFFLKDGDVFRGDRITWGELKNDQNEN